MTAPPPEDVLEATSGNAGRAARRAASRCGSTRSAGRRQSPATHWACAHGTYPVEGQRSGDQGDAAHVKQGAGMAETPKGDKRTETNDKKGNTEERCPLGVASDLSASRQAPRYLKDSPLEVWQPADMGYANGDEEVIRNQLCKAPAEALRGATCGGAAAGQGTHAMSTRRAWRVNCFFSSLSAARPWRWQGWRQTRRVRATQPA